MDTDMKNKSFLLPKPMAELLPELCSTLSKHAGQTLTARKPERRTIYQTRTAEKVFKPMTIAELNAAVIGLQAQSPKRNPQPNTAVKKLNWNSSVKLMKTKSFTQDEQIKHKSVRKVLNFHAKPKPATNVRATLISSETPKFPKPELRAKKSLHLLEKTSVGISGISIIPPTPLSQNKISKTPQGIRENKPYQANINRRTIGTPKNLIQKKLKQTYTDTPLSNISIKSNGDESFLLKEQEINDIEERTRALDEETLENIADISPPASTPFKEYRDVQEFFNNTCDTKKSYSDNTITSFDKVSVSKENYKREHSVIFSLCDMLNKATVTIDETNTELSDLLKVEKQSQQHIQMVEYGIKTLNNIRESQLKSLLYVRKLINEKKNHKPDDVNATSVNVKIETPTNKQPVSEKTKLRLSVIKTKSPSYQIPRKSMCLRKKVIRKSIPTECEVMQTPIKTTDKALNMYMQIREKMNFLNTPLVKQPNLKPPDTPSLTSHNLQKQLDKLYNES